ncbi:hypothetical protein QUB60_08765 [Microcoleus sp. A2-C5]|uniref:hypothetical protein n=1 Tax=unclassified Microcoleus TaxID=2642155 RepID=UPI002FD5724C
MAGVRGLVIIPKEEERRQKAEGRRKKEGRKKEEGRRKKAEGSSAADFLTDLADEWKVRQRI